MHYNPSDLSSWVESMLFELNAPPPPLPPATPLAPRLASTSSTVTSGATAGVGYFDLPPAVDSSSSTYALKQLHGLDTGAQADADWRRQHVVFLCLVVIHGWRSH